jgi:glycerol uptake facilitator-like aquaporin
MTLTLNIIIGGALTGAAFNPARALGPMLVTGDFTNAWLYIVTPLMGAILAAVMHKWLAWLAMSGCLPALPRSETTVIITTF